jgi:hypothetical protein
MSGWLLGVPAMEKDWKTELEVWLAPFLKELWLILGDAA